MSSGCTHQKEPERQAVSAQDSIKTKVIKVTGGFGYEIYVHDERVIYQPHIPALESIIPFPSERSAQRMAEIVVNKIRRNIIPPSLLEDEVDAVVKEYSIVTNN